MVAAEKVTPEAINFMAKYGRGLICLSLTPERVEELMLPMMVSVNRSKFQTAFTISIEARCGVAIPPQGQGGGRVGQDGSNRGISGSGAVGGIETGGCDLRGHE
jgi:hypothetical protein